MWAWPVDIRQKKKNQRVNAGLFFYIMPMRPLHFFTAFLPYHLSSPPSSPSSTDNMDYLHGHVYEKPVQVFAPVKVLSCVPPPTRKVVETPIQCSTGSFYKFFKKQASLLPSVCGAVVQTVGLADGNRSWVNTVGSRKVIEILAADSCSGTYVDN